MRKALLLLACLALSTPVLAQRVHTIGSAGNGGSTSPGGTTGQVQYNNAGAFGGFTFSGDMTVNVSTGLVTSTKINGVTPGGTCGANQFVDILSTSAVPTCAQVTFGNLGGGLASSQLPANAFVNYPAYISGNWSTSLFTVPQAGGAQAASTIYCSPYITRYAGATFKTMVVAATTGFATGHVSMAIYNDASGRPGALVDSIGTTGIALSGSSGDYQQALANATDTLPGTSYWACESGDNTTAIFVAHSTAGAGVGVLINSSTVSHSIGAASTVGGLACTAGGTCNTGAAWSTGSFTWPATLAGATWSDVITGVSPVIALQVN